MLEDQWKEYLQQENLLKNIDFIGINIGKDNEKPFQLKYYLQPVTDAKQLPQIYSQIYNIGCFSYFTPIFRSVKKNVRQDDVRLKKRTNDNMLCIFSYLCEIAPSFCRECSEVMKLAEIPICEKENHKYASLYYLCISQNEGIPETYKFHFLTRHCDEPDHIDSGFYYDNEFYLNFVSNIGIPQILECKNIITSLLNMIDADLWMIGSDYSLKTNQRKYKMYIKFGYNSFDDIFKALYFSLSFKKNLQLIKNLQIFENFMSFHEELKIYGMGVCCDSKMNITLNFYITKKV